MAKKVFSNFQPKVIYGPFITYLTICQQFTLPLKACLILMYRKCISWFNDQILLEQLRLGVTPSPFSLSTPFGADGCPEAFFLFEKLSIFYEMPFRNPVSVIPRLSSSQTVLYFCYDCMQKHLCERLEGSVQFVKLKIT